MRGVRSVLSVVLVASLALAGCASVVDQVTGRPSNTWALEMIGVSTAHERGLDGSGVRVAVVDTGIAAAHREFQGLPGGLLWGDVVNDRSRPYDDAGHGTHVSGIVVAQGNGGASDPRVLGAAPGATLIHVKAVPGGDSGQGSDRDVARAVDLAVSEGAHVLVLSLGSEPGLLPIGSQTEDAVNRAIDKGVVVVAAAGNARDGERGSQCNVKSPASLPRVIAAAAVDREKAIATFSCKGNNSGGPLGLMQPQDPNRKPELSAPGVNVLGPWPSRSCAGEAADYCVLSGTSQAAPYIGGVVALLLEANPEMKRQDAATVKEIKRALVSSAEKAPGQSTPHDDRYGYGIVRADRALDRLG